VVERDAIIQDRPVEFERPAAAEGGLIIRDPEIFIKVGETGLCVQRHILQDAREISPLDKLIARSAGKGGSHFKILERVLLKVGGRKPEQAFGEKEVQLNRPARVSSNEGIGVVTIDVATVDRQAELLTPSHEVSEQAGIFQMAVPGRLRVAASQAA